MDQSQLPAILERYRDAPFVWGEMDCCLFAADVVRDLTGIDCAAQFRGQYSTRFGAARMIRPYGSLAGLLDSILGEGRPAVWARRGDFVLGPVPEPAVGICTGNKAIFKSDGGFAALPLTHCYRSWPCPAQ